MARDEQCDPRNHHIWKSPGGALYFKLAVSAELRGRLPPTETGRLRDRITEPLGTDSFTQARVLRDQRLAHWQRVFAQLASGEVFSPQEITAERQRIRRNSLQALLATTPMTSIEASKLNALWVTSIQAQQPGLLAEMTAEVRAMADAKYGTGIITEDSEPWKEIWTLVARSKAKAFEDRLVVLFRSQSQLSEFPSEPPSPTMEQPVALPAPVNGNGNGNLERFSVALGHYLEWLTNVRKRRTATVAAYRAKGDRFVQFASDPSLGAVDIDLAKAFLADVAREVSDTNANEHQKVCAAVLEHARRERRKFTGENPFNFAKRQHTAKSKAKFTVDELNTLFNSPVFADREIKPKTYGVASALPWAALIALYSGAGLEEVAQLRPRDIRQEAGNGWVIDITPEAALSGALKRSARQRIIPLHPELERLGLLQYLAALPRGTERLFPGLPVPSNGKDKLGGALGKGFNRWRCKLGIDYADRQLDFHSLRHTFGKALEDAGITPTDCARLLGHAVKGISSSIYSGPELRRVAPLVAGVKWDGLKIDR